MMNYKVSWTTEGDHCFQVFGSLNTALEFYQSLDYTRYETAKLWRHSTVIMAKQS